LYQNALSMIGCEKSFSKTLMVSLSNHEDVINSALRQAHFVVTQWNQGERGNSKFLGLLNELWFE